MPRMGIFAFIWRRTGLFSLRLVYCLQLANIIINLANIKINFANQWHRNKNTVYSTDRIIKDKRFDAFLMVSLQSIKAQFEVLISLCD